MASHQVINYSNCIFPSLRRLQVVLPKLPTGYGFTVQGANPARVGHLKKSGAAKMYGILPGDEVIKVNGEDVSHETASYVANLVR